MIATPVVSTKLLSNVVEADAGHRRVQRDARTRIVTVVNPNGLHLRPCMELVETVVRHQAHVTVKKGDQSASAASILGLVSLAAVPGEELVLSATGPEADEALAAVVNLLTSGPE